MALDFTALFVYVDDFCKGFIPFWEKQAIESGLRKRNRATKLGLSEILSIVVMYHQSHFDCFKHYYNYVYLHHRKDFTFLLCYDRFVAVMKRALPVLCYMFQCVRGEATGIQFIDATTLEVCKIPRASRHKVFKGLAHKGKTTMGWFFGFKLHTLINHKGEIMAITITTGNVDDRTPVLDLVQEMFGKLFGDRGYISAKLTKKLADKGIQLVTRIKKNMKNILMHLEDKMLLYRRCLIETIFSKLKLFSKLWHSRHRSMDNAFTHLLASVIAYQLNPNKPSLVNFLQIA
jgi:Transposase DDE domain